MAWQLALYTLAVDMLCCMLTPMHVLLQRVPASSAVRAAGGL
jgi:hypothetical protein